MAQRCSMLCKPSRTARMGLTGSHRESWRASRAATLSKTKPLKWGRTRRTCGDGVGWGVGLEEMVGVGPHKADLRGWGGVGEKGRVGVVAPGPALAYGGGGVGSGECALREGCG